MFTPIKNFITYIQKNASGNSMFGGNCTVEGSRMEAEYVKAESVVANVETGNEVPKKVDKEGVLEKEVKEKICTETKKLCSELQELEFSSSTLTTSLAPSESVSEFEDEDIETQIQSIMLKKPLKVASTNGSEILELKKSSSANCGIVISHNHNQDLSALDDELEDFRNDPMEVSVAVSSACSHQNVDDFCSVGSAEEAFESVFRDINDFSTDDENGEVIDKKTENEKKEMFESDLEVEEEKDIETENEQSVIEIEDEEEPFLELESFKSNNGSVLDEVDLNTSTASFDTNNTADDPLAIPCEEHEAFAADKNAALEKLNLLNNSQTSQDDDTTTTTDEDLRWLKSDPLDNKPSCSRKVLLKDKNSAVMPEKEERNGEGSDSGLGSETSVLHTTITSTTDTSQLNINTASLTHSPTPIKTKESEKISNLEVLQGVKPAPENPPKPHRSNLKRRLEVDIDESLDSSITPTSSSLNEHIQKKPKRSINFDTVQVYYFPRQQGFSCVPSAGGCTLGMGARHVAFKTLSLAEHAAELRRAHRMQLQEINPRGSSSDDSEESEEDYLSEGSGSDLDGESNGFLQPVSPKQRRALLKAAGIRKIDPIEKAECRNIRNSREVCGCTCRDFCDPETCACSQSGIKCQVDRDMFPCGCSRDACGNTIGRVEFNPTRVRTHYIHTLMRLEMENRQQQNPYSSAVVSPIQPSPSSFYQTHLQPPSSYSSGYASPAYNTASEIHHQTVANVYYHTHNPSTSSVMYGQQTSLEISHNGTAANTTTSSHYGIDSMGTSLFGGTTTATPSYGELMPVASYHYGNVQTQDSPYNSYHDASYINANTNASSLSSSRSAYSSCAVPSIPPFGAATTTEAAGIYHSVSSLTNLETTTAPSCSVNGNGASLESDSSASFINLSTPLASSSRLSQINDLLQHNRNATTALVAVSDNIEATDEKSSITASVPQANSNNFQTTDSSLCSSFNASLADTNKGCIALEELVPPLKPVPSVPIFENNNTETAKTTIIACSAIEERSTKHAEEISLLKTEFLPKTSLYEVGRDTTTLTVSASIEPSTITAAAGN